MRLLTTILMLMLPLALHPQVKETVLSEHFDDNSAGWPEDYTDSFAASVNSGTYYLSHKRAAGSKSFDIPVKMYLGDSYFIETEGTFRSGDKNGGFGIIWGKGPGGFFSFAITPGGTFFVRRMTTGHSGKYLLGPTNTKHINLGERATNKLRVQYANGEIMFFINDKYAGHMPSELYYGNNAGIILYGRQDVDIHNFGAYGTKNYEMLKDYHAAMRVVSYEIEDGQDTGGEPLGNGDCKVSPGETIRLAVTMKNQGYSSCDGLKATFYAVSGYVTVIDQNVPQYINNVDRYHTQVLDLKFKVSSACRADRLNFKVDLTDSLGRLAETVGMTVLLNTPIPPINKDGQGKISFTVNLREARSDDINTVFPITLNNARSTYAVIVGVESYRRLPKAKYATNDARVLFNYLLKVINVPRNNIMYAINQKATLKEVGDILKVGGALQSKTYTQTGIDLIFYFTGLGICDKNTTEPYLLLYDSDPDNPGETAYPLSSLLKSLRGHNVNSLTCLFETSFAGVDRDGKPFGQIGGTVWSTATFPTVTDHRTCLMYASGGIQTNPTTDHSSHGLFTHYLISTIQSHAKTRTTLDMKHLYESIYQNMENDGYKNNISVFPRMDCINQDGIKILK